MGFRALTIATVLLGCALPARSQQSVTLQFNAGQVTLTTRNAPIRVILAEWARLGGATIVNGDRVAGPPVTLELIGVPEQQALDILLRSVAGYMLAPRRAGSLGASAFDRILILPTSAAPGNPPPTVAAAGGLRPGLPRPGVMTRQPEAIAAPVDAGQDAIDPDPPDPVANQSRTDPRLVLPPYVMRPPIDADLPDSDESPDNVAGPSAAGVAPTPGNPFGVPFGSSATPGVVTPAPRPQPQQQRPPTNGVQ